MTRMNRRRFITSSASLLAASQVPFFLRPAHAAGPPGSPLLVMVFLRGGADGLALVPPVGDPHLERLRPDLVPHAVIPLAGESVDFAWHPSLSALAPLAESGELALVHGVGWPEPIRSHFDAQDRCEWGTDRPARERAGWLARALASGNDSPSALRAVSVAPAPVQALSGERGAFAFERLEEAGWPTQAAPARAALSQLYRTSGDGGLADRVAAAGSEALAALTSLESLRVRSAALDFPETPLGRRFETVARLGRSPLPVAAAWVDADDWDTHARQQGRLSRLGGDLAAGLSALWRALRDGDRDVLILVTTEFGRTARPNGTGGTDHGRGSIALAIGHSVRGGGVRGPWPGLGPDDLEEGRDLRVATDVRSVYWAGARHLGATEPDAVFPGFAPTPLPWIGSAGDADFARITRA